MSRSARFVETELKLMQQIQEAYHDEMVAASLLDRLHVVQKAHMRFLQEEYHSLQIGGRYTHQQARTLFRAIRRDTTFYSTEFLEDIKTCIQIMGGCNNSNPANKFQHDRRGGFRGRYWGGRRDFSGRGTSYFNQFQQGNH